MFFTFYNLHSTIKHWVHTKLNRYVYSMHFSMFLHFYYTFSFIKDYNLVWVVVYDKYVHGFTTN